MMTLARSFHTSVISTVLLCVISSIAQADTSPLRADMKLFQVTDLQKQTKKALKATDQVKPSSVLEYRVDYSNVSTSSLKGLKLNLPIPAHVSYLGTSLPKNTFASVDGVNFEKAPLTRIVDGKKVAVPLSEYRALQWQVEEIKPKQTISVSAQVRVNTAE